MVNATGPQWALFLVGDATDEIIASFPPSIMNKSTERMIIIAQGLLGENEEFLVYRWSLPSESTKTLTPTEQASPTFFKPITAPKLSRREINASAVAARRNALALVVLMMVPYVLLLFQMLLTRNLGNVLATLSVILVMALFVLYAARRQVPKGLETFVEPLSLGEGKPKTWVEIIEEQLKKIRE